MSPYACEADTALPMYFRSEVGRFSGAGAPPKEKAVRVDVEPRPDSMSWSTIDGTPPALSHKRQDRALEED